MFDKPLHTPGFPNSACASPGLLLHKQRETSKFSPRGKSLLPTPLYAFGLPSLLPSAFPLSLRNAEVIVSSYFPPVLPAPTSLLKQHSLWHSVLLSSLSSLCQKSSCQDFIPKERTMEMTPITCPLHPWDLFSYFICVRSLY